MRLPDNDLRLDAPWTDGPAVPFLGLVPDADVLMLMHRPRVVSPLEMDLAKTLDRVHELSVLQGARIWVKSIGLSGIRPTTSGFGMHDWLAMPGPRLRDVDLDAELGKALTEGDPLPNGRSPSHLVWMDDGTHLPGEILRHFQKRALPFTQLLGYERDDFDPDTRRFFQRQRPGLRVQGQRELAEQERIAQAQALREVADAVHPSASATSARPPRRL